MTWLAAAADGEDSPPNLVGHDASAVVAEHCPGAIAGGQGQHGCPVLFLDPEIGVDTAHAVDKEHLLGRFGIDDDRGPLGCIDFDVDDGLGCLEVFLAARASVLR